MKHEDKENYFTGAIFKLEWDCFNGLLKIHHMKNDRVYFTQINDGDFGKIYEIEHHVFIRDAKIQQTE